jgi:hypothetical protein
MQQALYTILLKTMEIRQLLDLQNRIYMRILGQNLAMYHAIAPK